jgi:hypothetical protein
MSETERPNTLAGLNAKRAELLAYRKQLQAQVRKVTVDIDHLEAAARLFDPEATPNGVRRYVTRHRAKKGTVKRFILAQLREATAPLTSAQMTDLWLKDRGLRTDDATRVVIRKRIGAALISLRAQGVARNDGFFDGLKGWVRAGD